MLTPKRPPVERWPFDVYGASRWGSNERLVWQSTLLLGLEFCAVGVYLFIIRQPAVTLKELEFPVIGIEVLFFTFARNALILTTVKEALRFALTIGDP